MAGNSKTTVLNRFCQMVAMMTEILKAPFNPSYFEMYKPKPMPVKVSTRNKNTLRNTN